jgi:hypothetical protein
MFITYMNSQLEQSAWVNGGMAIAFAVLASLLLTLFVGLLTELICEYKDSQDRNY